MQCLLGLDEGCSLHEGVPGSRNGALPVHSGPWPPPAEAAEALGAKSGCSHNELLKLFLSRWSAELDLLSNAHTLQSYQQNTD